MSEMTAAKATALRKPFPPESVGKLPKPYKADSPKGNCPECHGYHGLPAVHLDYAGHAAVTDRLLTVDPLWSWEPFAVGPDGLPAVDRSGNMWIRLTICGVTRIGVGDGKSAKEAIGDGIRNAAMRFGVGLDLWAKENLVEFAQAARQTPAGGHAPDDPPSDVGSEREVAAAPSAGPTDERPMSSSQRGQMFALFGQKGIADDQQLAGVNAITGAAYESRGDLTFEHAKQVIDALKKRPDAVAETSADA